MQGIGKAYLQTFACTRIHLRSKKEFRMQKNAITADSLFQRVVSNKGKEELVSQTRERLPGEHLSPTSMLK